MPDSPSDSKVSVLTHIFSIVSANCQTSASASHIPLLDEFGSTTIMKLKLLFFITLIVVLLIAAEVRIHSKHGTAQS